MWWYTHAIPALETEAVNDAGVSFYWEFTTGVGCPKLEANPTVENKK